MSERRNKKPGTVPFQVRALPKALKVELDHVAAAHHWTKEHTLAVVLAAGFKAIRLVERERTRT